MWFLLLLVEGFLLVRQPLAYQDPYIAHGKHWVGGVGDERGARRACAKTARASLPAVLLATFGVAFALQASRLIVAHMCKVDFWPDRTTPAVMALAILNRFYPMVDSKAAAWAAFLAVTAIYGHYVVTTINEICRGLDIK